MTIADTFTPEQVHDTDVDASAGNSGRRRLYLAGAAAAVLGLGAGLYVMFGSAAPTDDSQFRLTTPAASAAPSVSSVDSSPRPVAPTAPKVGTRDPFKALKPGAVETPAAVADTSGSTTTGVTTDPTAPAAAPEPSPTSVPASAVTLTVSAIDPVAQTVVVDVDGKKYATGVGKTFAQSFSVYSVFNAQCVGILYGSQSTPVCAATPVSVTP